MLGIAAVAYLEGHSTRYTASVKGTYRRAKVCKVWRDAADGVATAEAGVESIDAQGVIVGLQVRAAIGCGEHKGEVVNAVE